MLEELKKKLRAYEDAKRKWEEVNIGTCFDDLAEAHNTHQMAYNDLHDFIFQGNITSEDIG